MVQDHLDAIHVLQARESILMANAVAVGTGTGKKEERRRLTGQWKRYARGRVHKPKAKQGVPWREVARMHGIGVVEEAKA